MGLNKNKSSGNVFEKIDRRNNPLYPPKKESVGKELLSAVLTTVICLVLVGVIAKNFNVYAIEQRRREKAEDHVSEENYTEENYTEQNYTDNYVEENYTEETIEGDSEEPVNDVQQFTEEPMEENVSESELSEEYEEVAAESEYIFEDSSVRLISEEELWDLSQEELNYARNEIYARYGRRFKDETIQNYFDSKSWYEGTIEPDDFEHEWLNEIEKENANTILAYEKKMGYK